MAHLDFLAISHRLQSHLMAVAARVLTDPQVHQVNLDHQVTKDNQANQVLAVPLARMVHPDNLDHPAIPEKVARLARAAIWARMVDQAFRAVAENQALAAPPAQPDQRATTVHLETMEIKVDLDNRALLVTPERRAQLDRLETLDRLVLMDSPARTRHIAHARNEHRSKPRMLSRQRRSWLALQRPQRLPPLPRPKKKSLLSQLQPRRRKKWWLPQVQQKKKKKWWLPQVQQKKKWWLPQVQPKKKQRQPRIRSQ